MRGTDGFEGGVFSATVEGGRSGARLELRPDGLHATTPDGAHFHLPYAACELSRGGASGRMWFCRARDGSITLFSESPGFDEALRAAARRELGPALEALDRAHGERRRRGVLLALAVLAVIGLVAAGGYFGVRAAGSAAIDLVPRSADEKLGELASEQLPLQGAVVDDPVVNGAVREIVERLAPHAGGGFTFQVKVIDAPVVNAFALPGGYMVVYTGLLRAMKTPEQLAGVLAHEMAHVTLRHGMRRIAQSVGVIATIQLLLGDVSGLAAVAVELLREGALSSYSREQEGEADLTGVGMLARAAIDPRGLAEFFELLRERPEGKRSLVTWLSTHPDLAERSAAVRRAAAELEPKSYRPLSLSWSDVQARVAPN